MMYWATFLADTFPPLFHFTVYNCWSRPIAVLFSPCVATDIPLLHHNDNEAGHG